MIAAFKVLCYKKSITSYDILLVEDDNITIVDQDTDVEYNINVLIAEKYHALNKSFMFLLEQDDETIVEFIVNHITKFDSMGFTFTSDIYTFLSDDDFCKLWIETIRQLIPFIEEKLQQNISN